MKQNIGDDDQDLFQDENNDPELNKKNRKKQFYVRKSDLLEEIRKYQESKKNDPDGKGLISEQLGTMILKICTRFSMHPRFYGYSYRDQFVQDAVVRCLSHSLDRIDLSLPNCNPFSYLTQTAYNVFRQRIKNQKKFMKAKQNLRDLIYTQFQQSQNLQRTKQNQDDFDE